MTARTRTNTPTEQNKEDNQLVLYRLELVEAAVKDVGQKLDKQENIKRSDLIEFRDTIVIRVNEIRDGLQKQIDDKADQKQVDDLRGLVRAGASFFATVIAAFIVYYFTRPQ